MKTFEKMRTQLLTTLEENETKDDIFDALGAGLTQEQKDEFGKFSAGAVHDSRRKTDLVKAAINRAENFNQFAAYLTILVMADTRITTLLKSKAKEFAQMLEKEL